MAIVKCKSHCNQMCNDYCWISDPIGSMSPMQCSLEKPAVVPSHNVRWNLKSRLCVQRLVNGEKHINYHTRGKKTLVSCAKTAEATNTTKSDGGLLWLWNELCNSALIFLAVVVWMRQMLFLITVIIFWFLNFKH